METKPIRIYQDTYLKLITLAGVHYRTIMGEVAAIVDEYIDLHKASLRDSPPVVSKGK